MTTTYTRPMKHTLESHALFPYVAWGLVLGFVAFTYVLATNVQKSIANLDHRIVRVEQSIENTGSQKPIVPE